MYKLGELVGEKDSFLRFIWQFQLPFKVAYKISFSFYANWDSQRFIYTCIIYAWYDCSIATSSFHRLVDFSIYSLKVWNNRIFRTSGIFLNQWPDLTISTADKNPINTYLTMANSRKSFGISTVKYRHKLVANKGFGGHTRSNLKFSRKKPFTWISRKKTHVPNVSQRHFLVELGSTQVIGFSNLVIFLIVNYSVHYQEVVSSQIDEKMDFEEFLM